MALQDLQNKDTNLVLSSDPKPRLKWTPELHQRFIDAVTQLGGSEKATPKSLMRLMNIHGLTLYHLKSHLQKFRLAKSQELQSYHDDKDEDYKQSQSQESQMHSESSDGAQNQMNESMQISQALQMQMEVQRKLHEQIKVQKHLQLRIEAQGKYLQSVLKKAQETLARYGPSDHAELAKSELSQLVSMVDTGCPSSSLSVLTEIGGSISNCTEQLRTGIGCSLDSSLTSSESSGRKEDTQERHENKENDERKENSVELSLMEMHPGQQNGSKDDLSGRKRSRSIISFDNCVEKPSDKRFQASINDEKLKKFGFLENIDLNSECVDDFDT
ncbi:myb family transcription factor PHL8-like [Ipomoea triloba]|uniref:myb family transcription factor PHL8-like n=1 Tax=Ipomoea triloba TaxID=35885 RepID=UPI00125E8EDF|nr:myb family transcription factor PHL8-like [Ipomoea triloba]